MTVTIEDFPESVRDALGRGEEILLLTTEAVSVLEGNADTDGIRAETNTGWPEEPTPAVLALVQAVHSAVKSPVRYYLKQRTAVRIARTHERNDAPRMPVFTIRITGKINADGNLAAHTALTVHEAFFGVGAVRVAADRALRGCREAFTKGGLHANDR